MKFRLAAAAVILVLGMAAAAQTASIQLDNNLFKVVGWNAPVAPPAGGWSSVFVVYAGDGDVPPLAGAYGVEGGVLVFRPTYPMSTGVRYRAVFHPPGAGGIEQIFQRSTTRAIPSARVDAVYPTADVLPSNTLRLYIYFSASMSRGEAAARIHLLDQNGEALSGVFLPGEELWDPNHRRLTMTFDPGRIKRGLKSNEQMGPPITVGARYTLVIDQAWQDAGGAPLVTSFRRTFRGGPAVRTPPDPKTWRIAPPPAGSPGDLVVDFPASMNYPLLERMLSVSGPSGAVPGSVRIGQAERQWRFTPREPWRAGAYHLVANTGLEDLAGNRIGQPFDIDTFARVTEHITSETIAVPFVVHALH